MKRRDFLLGSGAFVSLAACQQSGGGAVKQAATASAFEPWTNRAGIQLYTCRHWIEEHGVADTLKRIAKIGIKEIEMAGFKGLSVAEWKTILDGEGLTTPSAHYQLHDLLKPEFREEVFESAEKLGQSYVTIPWLNEEDRESLDDYKKVAEHLNTIGAACSEAGYKLAYHNHEFEFDEFDGKVAYDLMLEETDSSIVDFEMDLAWVVAAGKDVVEYIDRYSGRFSQFHVKDITADKKLCAVGLGVVPFAEIFKKAEMAGLQHAYYEHDYPVELWAEMQSSFEHMKKLGSKIPTLKS